MKVYVASKWSRRAEAQRVILDLLDRGHEITHDWTGLEDPVGVPEAERAAFWGECARADHLGVDDADLVLVLHDPAGRGMFVETGIAIGLAKPILVVNGLGDPAQNCPIFYYLPEVQHVATVGEALDRIDAMDRRAA